MVCKILFLQVILPIVVFGGLGLGALAFVDSINYRVNLCNKVSFYTNWIMNTYYRNGLSLKLNSIQSICFDRICLVFFG